MASADDLIASRRAEPRDQPVIDALVEAAVDELGPQRGGELLLGFDRPLHPTSATSDQQLALVGLIDGTVVGYARCHIAVHDPYRVASIHDLYVHPEGRGVGVAATMLHEIRRWADDAGCTHLESQVLPGNRDAKNFFERVGMVTRRMQVSTAL